MLQHLVEEILLVMGDEGSWKGPQSNDWSRGLIEFVQHFHFQGEFSIGARALLDIHFDMDWLCCSPIPVGRRGVIYLFKLFIPTVAALRKGGGGKHPVGRPWYLTCKHRLQNSHGYLLLHAICSVKKVWGGRLFGTRQRQQASRWIMWCGIFGKGRASAVPPFPGTVYPW